MTSGNKATSDVKKARENWEEPRALAVNLNNPETSEKTFRDSVFSFKFWRINSRLKYSAEYSEK